MPWEAVRDLGTILTMGGGDATEFSCIELFDKVISCLS